MTTPTLPPQAYTKETLTQAYSWLQTQPDYLQKLARSPDQLVSLYKRASLKGGSLEQDPTYKSFQNQLKELSQELNQFESEELSKTESANMSSNLTAHLTNPAATTPNEKLTFRYSPEDSKVKLTERSSQSYSQPELDSQFNLLSDSRSDLKFDSLTQSMIREVKQSLNLSNEQEAIRMLIKLGYTQVKNILPKA